MIKAPNSELQAPKTSYSKTKWLKTQEPGGWRQINRIQKISQYKIQINGGGKWSLLTTAMGCCLSGSSLRKPGILDLKCTQSTVKDQIQCKTKGQGEPPKRELQSSLGAVRNSGSTLQMEIWDFSSCPRIAGSSHSPPIPGDKGTVLVSHFTPSSCSS